MILGLETSCDETAAAVVTADGRILANVVSSQAELHARFGGVVPEVASRRHLELVVPVLREALGRAGIELAEVDAVAVTQGPGLVGALLVGLAAAKALAWANRLPLVPVDHLHGHIASLYLQPERVEPPFLGLLASGGHTLVVDVAERGDFRVLGTTLDDAAGEAFDKGARLLGLGYPGGVAIDKLSTRGDPDAYDFPVARVPGLDFSFSGLKTALLYTVRELAGLAFVIGAGGTSSTARTLSSSAGAWRGLAGSARPQVDLGQRVIVVLKAPSLAQRVAGAGGRATDSQERQWTTAALAAQQQVLATLAQH